MPDRRATWRTLALLAAAATAVAACSSKSSSSSSASSAGTTGTTAAAAGATCPAGTSIGFFGALTGDSANLGINEDNGMKLALQQFNKANPNCQVNHTEYDSQGSPAPAPGLAAKAVSDSKVVGIVGPAFSGESEAANPTFNDAGLPIITASATKVTLSTHGWKIFHRAVGTDAAQGGAIASYLQTELSAKKVALIDDGSAYGKGIFDVIKGKIGALATVTDEIDPKGTDFSSTVNKIKGGSVDAVFFSGYYQAAGVLAKQLHDAGVSAKFIAPDGSEDPGFVTAAGNAAAEGAILTAPAAPIEIVKGGADFQTAYKAAFNVDVGLYSVEAYDAANMFLDALSHGASTRTAINDYLGNKTDYEGLSKHYKFDSKGELAGTVTVYAYQVKGGKIVGLKPINA